MKLFPSDGSGAVCHHIRRAKYKGAVIYASVNIFSSFEYDISKDKLALFYENNPKEM